MGDLTIGSLFAGIGGFDLGFERAGFKTVWQCEIDKAAQGVLRKHFPDATLHSDVCEVGAHNLEPVDVVTFGSPCFPAGVLVLTRRGLVAIEEVVVGDEVVSHLGRWQPVVRVGSKIAPTIRLKGQGHPGLVTTEEHPFWASAVGRKWNNDLRQYRREFGPLEWTPAKDMQGRMWSSLTEFPAAAVPPMVMDKWETSCPAITPELMWVVGSWVGDGWVRDAKRAGREDSHWGNVLIADGKGAPAVEVRKRLQAANLTFWESDERTTTRFVVSSAPFARWLTTHFGRYAEGKTIPAWLLGAPLEMREAFLQGYLFADGSKLKGKGYRMTSVSKRLTFGIAMLIRCTRPSESVSIYWTAPHEGRQIEGRLIKEQASWQAQVCHESRSSLLIDGYRMGLVRECAPTGSEERVYNIEVEGDHSYTADGIIVHNCQDLSVAGKRAGLAGGRSGLFHEAARIIRELRERYGKPDFAIWENVPGAFSSNDGKDFEAVVQAMVDLGARDVCWRVLDSRYFGVAQRRRRVFLVADFGGERAEQILFEPESLLGDFKKSGKKGKGASRGTGAGASGGGGGDVVPAVTSKWAKGSGGPAGDECQNLVAQPVAFAQNTRDEVRLMGGDGNIVGALAAQPGMKQTTYVAQAVAFSPLQGGRSMPVTAESPTLEAGTGNKAPAVLQPIAFHPTQDPISSTDGSSRAITSGSRQGCATVAVAVGFDATGSTADAMIEAHPVLRGVKGGNASHHTGVAVCATVAVAFTTKDHGADATENVAPTMRSMGHAGSHANGGGQLGVAVCATGAITHALKAEGADGSEDGTGRGVPITAQPILAPTLTAANNPSRSPQSTEITNQVSAVVAAQAFDRYNSATSPLSPTLPAGESAGGFNHVMAYSPAMQVRRLTPVECESLQGFPRDWTAEATLPNGTIKPQADGPRYKQLGNAVTVNVAEWIARRVRQVVE